MFHTHYLPHRTLAVFIIYIIMLTGRKAGRHRFPIRLRRRRSFE